MRFYESFLEQIPHIDTTEQTKRYMGLIKFRTIGRWVYIMNYEKEKSKYEKRYEEQMRELLVLTEEYVGGAGRVA